LMVFLYYKHRPHGRLPHPVESLPHVTVQLPVFNEIYVVGRLIDAVARLDYPRELLEIQVLDDSTDETQAIARRRVELYRERGMDIHYIHRENRTGFKAGALAATVSVTSFYVVSQKELYEDWKRRVLVVPFLMSVGIGLSLNNARGVMEALIGRESPFIRTPKYRIESSTDRWRNKRYSGRRNYLPFAEIALGLYFTAAVAFATTHRLFAILPFLVLFQVGFLYTGVMSHPWREPGAMKKLFLHRGLIPRGNGS